MNRNFIPGEYTVGSAAESFLELERVGSSPVHEAITVAACQNCIQLEYCRDNKKEIAETIRHKGADHVIVAGEIIERLAERDDFNPEMSPRLYYLHHGLF